MRVYACACVYGVCVLCMIGKGLNAEFHEVRIRLALGWYIRGRRIAGKNRGRRVFRLLGRWMIIGGWEMRQEREVRKREVYVIRKQRLIEGPPIADGGWLVQPPAATETFEIAAARNSFLLFRMIVLIVERKVARGSGLSLTIGNATIEDRRHRKSGFSTNLEARLSMRVHVPARP